MFGELSKLFDRNFAIGYFLPVIIFVAVSFGLLCEFNPSQIILTPNIESKFSVLTGVTIIGLLSWLGGVFLFAVNRDLLRLMEGYGRFNPARLFCFVEKRRYKRLKQAISQLDAEYKACESEKKEFPQEICSKRVKLMQEIVKRFPDEERWVLPTSFGNTIRAFEVYPRIIYGLDAIPGWSRLLGVISEDYRNLIDNSKALVDFWSNLWLLSILFFVEYIGIVIYVGQVKVVWIPVVTVGVIFIVYSRARVAAIEWGDLIKSSFDIFLPDLFNKLGFSPPATTEEQKSLWEKFSQTIMYANPACMPNYKQELKSAFMAEKVAKELLSEEKWNKRNFEEIKKHLGGFEDNELRKILVRAGAVRFEKQGGGELWGNVNNFV